MDKKGEMQNAASNGLLANFKRQMTKPKSSPQWTCSLLLGTESIRVFYQSVASLILQLVSLQ
jgi:hypothetical protein